MGVRIIGPVVVVLLALSGCASPVDRYDARAPSLAFPRSTCPAALHGIRDVARADGPEDALLTTAPARAALICTYSGTGGARPSADRALAGRARLGPAAATALATAAAEVSVARPPDGAVACPADSGTTTVITFAYRAGPPRSLWWNTSGCQTLDDGRLEASQPASPTFARFQEVFQRTTGRAG